jgi:hypothetical protein
VLYHGLVKQLGPGELVPPGPLQDALVQGRWCQTQPLRPLVRLLPGPTAQVIRVVQRVSPFQPAEEVSLAATVTLVVPELEVVQVDLTTGKVTPEVHGPLVAVETTRSGLALVAQLAEPDTATTLASLAAAAPQVAQKALASLTKPRAKVRAGAAGARQAGTTHQPDQARLAAETQVNGKRATLVALRALLSPDPPKPPRQTLSLVGQEGVVRLVTGADQHVGSLAVAPDQTWLLYSAVPAETRQEPQPQTLWRVALPDGVPVALPGEVSRVWAVVEGGRSALARAMYDGAPQTVLVDLSSGLARVVGPDAEAVLVLGESALLAVSGGSLLAVTWDAVALAEPPTGTALCTAGGLPAWVQPLPAAGLYGCSTLLALQWWDGESLARAAQWCQLPHPEGPPPAQSGLTAALPLRATPDLSVLVALVATDSNFNGQLEPSLDNARLCLFPRSVEPLPGL